MKNKSIVAPNAHAVIVALFAACMFQGCTKSTHESKPKLHAEMDAAAFRELFGEPHRDASGRVDSEVWLNWEYYPENDIPYSPFSTNLVVSSFDASDFGEGKISYITVAYTTRDRRKKDDAQIDLSERAHMSANLMPDSLPRRLGKIRAGMTRDEVKALLGEPDSKTVSCPGFDDTWMYSPKNNIPYSSSSTDFVVVECAVCFSRQTMTVDEVFVIYMTRKLRKNTRD